MPFLSKPTRRVSAARRPPGKRPAEPAPAKPPKPPAKPAPAKPPKRTSRPVPTGASGYVIESRRDLGTMLDGKGWTRAQFASCLGVKYWTVVEWERGGTLPSQGDLNAIERTLELARRGADPRSVTAPNVEQLIAEPGPVKPPKQRSIIKPDRLGPRGKRFTSVEPRNPAS